MADAGVVLVVGASLGLGSAGASRFVEAGMIVAVSTRTQDAVDDLAGKINRSGGTSTGYVADATDEDTIIPCFTRWSEI